MRILIACEFSGIVRDAFIKCGHDAWSCDLLDTDAPGPHIKGDVRLVTGLGWDMMIAFPPCTHLCVSGARWFAEKRSEQNDAIQFVRELWDSPIPMVCIENPIGVLSTRFMRPSQYIQPYEYGHEESKRTCLWLRGLSRLIPTNIVPNGGSKMWLLPPTADRWKKRSITYRGIAEAMASQWG